MDISTKYVWVEPLKDKKGKTVLNVFMEIVNKSNCTPNKLWVDPDSHIRHKIKVDLDL